MAPSTSWTPSKAQAFDVVVPAETSPETVVDATASIVGLSEVHCVQHMGGMNFQVTVKSTASMTLIVDAGYLTIGGERIPVVPVGPQDLSPYGKVLTVTAGVMSARRGVLTGTRYVRMEMSPTNRVPNYLRVSGHRVTFDYRGLQRVCRRCGSSGHYRAQCTAPFCGRCCVHGHESEGCDRPCRRCGDNHPTTVCPVRRSYSDATAGTFPALASVSPTATDERELVAVLEERQNPILGAPLNDEEVCSLANPSVPRLPISAIETAIAIDLASVPGKHVMPCSTPAKAEKEAPVDTEAPDSSLNLAAECPEDADVARSTGAGVSPGAEFFLHNTAGPVKGPSRRDVFTKLVIRTTEDQEYKKREE